MEIVSAGKEFAVFTGFLHVNMVFYSYIVMFVLSI